METNRTIFLSIHDMKRLHPQPPFIRLYVIQRGNHQRAVHDFFKLFLRVYEKEWGRSYYAMEPLLSFVPARYQLRMKEVIVRIEIS